MTSTELLKNKTDTEPLTSHIEKLERAKEGSLLLANAKPLEKRGDFSRIATFEIGSNINDEHKAVEEIDPSNPYAVVLDIWTAGDKVFALPRSGEAQESEDIASKAWDLAELPEGLLIGRQRNSAWQEKTGNKLPGEVSGRHLDISVKDGELHFTDLGSSNGTRMETAIIEDLESSVVETTPRKQRAFGRVTGLLVEIPKPKQESDISSFSGVLVPEPAEKIQPTTIHERLHTEPLGIESASEPEKSVAKSEEVDQNLRAMKGGVDGWLRTLREKPTITSVEQMYRVSGELIKQMAWLDEMTQKELDPELKTALEVLRVDMQDIETSARNVASNVERDVYQEGSQAHRARREVEHKLERYSGRINEIFQLLSEQSQATH